MNHPPARRQIHALVTILGALALVTGCATTENRPTPLTAATGSTEPAYRKDKHLQKVWLADGFNFSGYDALYVTPTRFAATERANELAMRASATRLVQEDLAASLRETGLFKTVVTRSEDLRPGVRGLTLENTIVEFEKGGGGARFWAGLYGAGQPVIKVHGKLTDGSRALFEYEARRSGESGGARMAGAFMSDEEIQRQDIHDLAIDLADFLRRTAGLKK